MRPITFEEREELILQAHGQDLIDFVHELGYLGRKHQLPHRRLLALLERAPRPTDIPHKRILVMRNKLAEGGREMTPDEATETMELVFCKLRNYLRDNGHEVPESDVDLLNLLS